MTFLRNFLVLMMLWCCAVPVTAQAGDVPQTIDLLSGFKTDIYWLEDAAKTKKPAPPQCEGTDALGTSSLPPTAAVWPGQGKRPLIAIVIDDVGLDIKRSRRALDLPAGVTLAFLPYSPQVAAQAADAAAKGHELMVHLPMEPLGMRANPGPNYLGVEHTEEELKKRIAANLDAFKGYAGVNNHMGSAFTSHAPGMKIFMAELKKRNVFFLDSKTAPESVAEDAAKAAGIRATHRDVFIDHYEDPVHVLAALEKVERVARAAGSAVAIGHPKDVTLDALMQWLPTLEAKGFDLVPMSEVVTYRKKQNAPYTPVAAQAIKPPMTQTITAEQALAAEKSTAAETEETERAEKPHTAATSKILPSHMKYNR